MPPTPASIRYRFDRFELQPDERRLLAEGADVHLGRHAFDVLVVLVERSGHLVTKEQLFERVWPRVVVEENTIQVHVSALRKVLGPDVIATVPGRGYRFASDVVRVDVASATEASEPTNNLPNQLTSFIGRETEIAQVKNLLGSARLLTLTGAGGCGKTRLALRAASEVLAGYRDGVWLVELAPLGDSALVPQTVVNTLSVSERAGTDHTDTLAEWLGSKRLLLVLDNAEHVLNACAQLADTLLRRCADLKIVVTSRERLGIAGESTYRVPSLSLPASLPGAKADVLACEAARLFIDRARLHSPDLEIASSDTAALASICHRLGGIALAIELAAPRLRAMSMSELSSDLNRRFALLTGGSRTALPRHRTLRSLIDWSYDLLNESEKTVFRRASAFAGGWTVETAETVCSGDGVDPIDVMELLTSLADKSLVVAETRGAATRFTMLETVRNYARDCLRDSGEETAVRERHVDWFVARACALDEIQSDEERQAKLARLDDELDNLRAALAVSEGSARAPTSGILLATHLFWFWRTRGFYQEGRRWIARLLAVGADGSAEDAVAQAHMAAGSLALQQSDFSAAETHIHVSLAIRRRIGPRRKVGTLVGNLGAIALARDDSLEARSLIEEALAIAREVDDRRSIAWGLHSLGLIACEAGDYAAAAALIEESVPVRREFGRWYAADALSDLGKIRHALGDMQSARTALAEALDSERAFGNRQGIAKALVWLGMVTHDEGDVTAAKAQLQEALDILHAVDDPGLMAVALEAFAGVVLDCAGPIDAARLWGCAQRLHEKTGSPQGALERGRSERQVPAARDALQDDDAFDRAWSAGRESSLDAIVRDALAA